VVWYSPYKPSGLGSVVGWQRWAAGDVERAKQRYNPGVLQTPPAIVKRGGWAKARLLI
jgi:hypothetical protein